jgi:hypothetical protein
MDNEAKQAYTRMTDAITVLSTIAMQLRDAVTDLRAVCQVLAMQGDRGVRDAPAE